MKTRRMLIPFALGLGLAGAVLWLLCGGTASVTATSECRPLQAPGDIITVCLSGGCDYTSVQAAVDAANDGDVIKVAAGVYTDVHVCPRNDVTTIGVVTHVVYVSKTVTIRGGYTTTNSFADPPDPEANPTTLGARGQGRVLYITGDISPTIEGLRITGGDATGMGGGFLGDAGGGMYVINATSLINNNQMFNNTAEYGGGLFLRSSAAMLSGNTVISNTAVGAAMAGGGGGLYLFFSDATLNDNTIISNSATATGGYPYHGGGLFLWGGDVTMSSNTISGNSADSDHSFGGGLSLTGSDATLSGNTISGNTACYGGGGLYLGESDTTLSGNIVSSNTANYYGGGLYLGFGSDATLDNNFITDNALWGDGKGSGLYVTGSSPQLRHNTIAHNSGGDGSGIYIGRPGTASTVVLTNTILVSHTVGIIVTAGNTATLEATLWGTNTWANTTDWDGAGTIFTDTLNVWDTPAFVDPAHGDYHIGLGSAAIDKGVDTGVTVDIDGEPRPVGTGYDIGADEFPAALSVTKQSHPDPVQAGGQLTYTIRVTNTGNVDLHATITDTLPAQVTPTGTLTWTPDAIAPGGVWTEQFSVTVEMGYARPLTNVVEVTTEEGAAGVYTETSQAQVTPALSVTKRANPDPVQAGAQLTYTIRVTNTGNVDLHATVTDTLPAQVTPTGMLTWTPGTIAPGGVWTEQVVVTVAMGYVGPLTNVVQVMTEEGATGVYTEVSTVPNQSPYTPTNPIPTDFATDVPITQTLRWQGGDPDGHPVTYTVAFGASDPPPIVGQVGNLSYDPGPLSSDTTYYWAITASDGISISVGDTWRFTTVGFKYVYLPLVLRQCQ